MAKYKGLNKATRRSPAARQADERNKAMRKTRRGDYQSLSAQSKPKRMNKAQRRAVKLETFEAKVIPQPPRTPIMDKGMTLRQLLKNTPRLMREHGAECDVSGVTRMRTAKGLPAVKALVVHKDPFRPEKIVRRHEVIIVGLDDPNKTINKNRRVMVSCKCENFVFMWEYALAVHGAARVIYGNGEPPTMTNLAQVPGVCKHITALANVIMAEDI